MNTQEQILTRLSELHDQRQTALNEVALIDGVISFWEQRLDELKKEDIEEQEAEQERLMEHEHRHNEPHEYDHDYYYEYRGESSPGGIGYCGAGS